MADDASEVASDSVLSLSAVAPKISVQLFPGMVVYCSPAFLMMLQEALHCVNSELSHDGITVSKQSMSRHSIQGMLSEHVWIHQVQLRKGRRQKLVTFKAAMQCRTGDARPSALLTLRREVQPELKY